MWAPIDGFVFSLGLGAGGALIWFYKIQIQKLVIGANALSKKLHAQADALAPKVTAAVDTAKSDAAKVASTASAVINDVKSL